MLSFEEIYTRITTLLSDTSTATTTLAKDLVNDYYGRLMSQFDWDFDEQTTTISTVADQQFYQIPANVRKVMFRGVQVTVGSTNYSPQEITNEHYWNRLNSSTVTSDTPLFFFIRGNYGNDQVGLFPIPASDGNTITFRYKQRFVDLSADDYTTGTVTTLANDGTAVTGSGTTWTSAMVGRFFKIDADGVWYRVSAFTDATHITLQKPYLGTSISGGSENYTIGELPYLPGEYHQALVYGPLADLYYQRNEEERGNYYGGLYRDIIAEMKRDRGRHTMRVVQPSRAEQLNALEFFDPNSFPENLTS